MVENTAVMMKVAKLFLVCLSFVLLNEATSRTFPDHEAKSSDALGVDTIYTQVDVIPRFHGGPRGWSTFLNKHLNVRQIQESIDEDAYISYGLVQQANLEFTVCEDGRVCDVDVLNEDKISPEFRDEVLRVLNRSPRWKPAIKDGKAVKTRFRQPVTVNLRNP